MENSNIPYEERELIQRAIKQAKPYAARTPRWVLVRRVFATSEPVSRAICTRYGFDPDQSMPALMELSDEAYRENLLQHGADITAEGAS